MKPEDFLLVQPQQARAVAKFRSMVAAAGEVLAESGIGGLTSDAIAARAVVNISMFYKYFANRDALPGYMAVTFIEEQTASLIRLIERTPASALLDQMIPAMIDTAVDDWASNPTSRALQGIFILDPVLYAEYSRSSLDVAAALRPFMAAWNVAGTYEGWQRMHLVFGDCAIVLFDRAAKAEPDEQAKIIIQLKNLAVAYFRTAILVK
jgi:AcrR family transcriptional regulator